MVRLRRIPAIRAANLLTLTIAIPYGILFGLYVIFFSAVSMTPGGQGQLTILLGALSAWAFAIIFLWVSIAIACALYNLIAGRLGGIDLEFQTIPPAS